MQLTRTHRILIGVVVTGAVIIAGIGFAGSYAAVRDLAERKGFGEFAVVFPIGIDAGICVLLALDLLLTWMRIPFPLLRQTAWLLTIATIAFNGAASWPDPLGVGMHAVIPVLFVVSVEAARHAVGRIADITADKHMEGVRLTRWLLSPVPTFKLWRRMKLWELRSYEQVIKLEQDRLIYQARLQARFGRGWRRKAPVESLMPLRLAKYGVPLAETSAAGLAAAGVEPMLLPPVPQPALEPQGARPADRELPVSLRKEPAAVPGGSPAQERPGRPQLPPVREQAPEREHASEREHSPERDDVRRQEPGGRRGPGREYAGRDGSDEMWPEDEWPHEEWPEEPEGYEGEFHDRQEYDDRHRPHPEQRPEGSPWFTTPPVQRGEYEGGYDPEYDEHPGGRDGAADARGREPAPVQVPTGASGDRTRDLADPALRPEPAHDPMTPEVETGPEAERLLQEEQEFYEAAYPVFVSLSHSLGDYPKVELFDIHLTDVHGITHAHSSRLLRQAMPAFKERFQAEMVDEHIA
ncbi:DUF2637 domain-containing protein [Streptomyces sp. NPDC020141]|uniref:DUF2637 domain-containing protein n=1 Tax=Streptomyces sp. NPDC020141 TaxID=3365065 RepID=UPI0037B9BDF8